MTNPYPDPERAELLFACDRLAETKRLSSDRKRALWNEVCGADATPETVALVRVEALRHRLEFFDAEVPRLLHNASDPGAFRTFYAQQAGAVRQSLHLTADVLDVGCGPRLLYRPWPGQRIIGLDPSQEALRYNHQLDRRLHGSATHIPWLSCSVDAIVCFYSLHHIVGRTRMETLARVEASLREFRRVLQPGGRLLVVEVAPWWPMGVLQRVLWAVRPWPMFFWPRRALTQLVAEEIPNAALSVTTFRVPWGVMLPPVFAWPWLRMPRGLYPFTLCLYDWRLAP